MSRQQTILLLGATGRTGGRVLQQLLARGLRVRAIVRSRGKLPPGVAGNAGLTVIEASLPALRDEELQEQLRGCDAVISCLGHVLTLRGIFGPPWDLVARATARVARGIEALRPAVPVRLIVMTSVSVNRPGGLDARRSSFEKAFLWLLRGLVPPTRDNQRAADHLLHEVGPNHPFVEWVVVRPDSLLEGEVSEYALHEGLVNGLSAPGSTRMASAAHFMCELATSPETWAAWKGRLPVIVDAAVPKGAAAKAGRAAPT